MSPPKSNAHSVLNNVKNIVASPTLQRNSDEGKLVNGNNSGRKKLLSKTIKAEYNYIQQLFEVLDIAALNQGRKSTSDGNDEDLQLQDILEKKRFKKTQSKKSNQYTKKKSYPHTIEDIEKELGELKGTPSTYQNQLRKKGLQIRLIKKKKKENLRLHKAALQQGKKIGGNSIKPVVNSEGNIVSNKFDFADSEGKTKRRRLNSTSLIKDENESDKSNHPNFLVNQKCNSLIKKDCQNGVRDEKNSNEEDKCKLQGPMFNKDNKMVFSKITIPYGNLNKKKKKKENDPIKVLNKLKEESLKVTELEKEDKEKATIYKEKQKWSTALKRASGEKVKDDQELLKKSIVKEKNKKKKSQKKWQERINRVLKDKDERQKKRTENIKSRINENKKNKLKKAIKKGRFVPL